MNKAGGIAYLLKHGRAPIPTVTRTEMPRTKGVKRMADGGLSNANAPLNYGTVPDYVFVPGGMTTDEKGRPVWKSGRYELRTPSTTPAATAPTSAVGVPNTGGDGGRNGTDTSSGNQNPSGVNDSFHSLQNFVNTPFGTMLASVAGRLGLLGEMKQNPTNVEVSDAYGVTPAASAAAAAAQAQREDDAMVDATWGGYDPRGDTSPTGYAADGMGPPSSASQAGIGGTTDAMSGGFGPGTDTGASSEGRGAPGEGNQGGGYSGAGNDRDAVGGWYSNGKFNQKPKHMATGGIGALADHGGYVGSYAAGGRMLRGPGDGLSDHIPAVIGKGKPARLADGEFVVSADVVSSLGGGSTEAGARKLYAMMDRIRKAAHGSKKQVKKVNDGKVLPA